MAKKSLWHICNLCHCGIVANSLQWADGQPRKMDQMPHKFLFATKTDERYSYPCFIAKDTGWDFQKQQFEISKLFPIQQSEIHMLFSKHKRKLFITVDASTSLMLYAGSYLTLIFCIFIIQLYAAGPKTAFFCKPL